MAEAAVATASFVILPALVMGLIIGLIELFFVHADEAGMGWMSHGLHAIPVTMIFVFISMNLSFVYTFLPFVKQNFTVDLGIRVLIGIIAMIKISAAAAIVRGSRVGEKLPHTLLIGALVIAAPYIWIYLAPVMTPMLPKIGLPGTPAK